MTESHVTTATALMDAAEELFAIDGFEAASLRAVMRTAGADSGAVHYHFGGRAELAAAVLERVLAPLNARRLELLAEAEERADGAPIALGDLIEAVIRPDIEAAKELRERGQARTRLIGEIYVNPARYVKERVEAHFRPVAQRFLPHLVAAVPEVPARELSWRVRWCVFGVLGALMSDAQEPFDHGVDELIDRLVTVTSAAVAASSPKEIRQ